MKPIIIIGAPRSGTNMLRDILASHPDCSTWPCDEINPIWRVGVENHPHDELTPSDAKPATKRAIHRAFRRQKRRGGTPEIVEKTCANSLRIAYVESLLEEPRYVHIVRDGRDAVPSAMKRWRAPFEFRYTLQKANFVPKTRIPLYVWRTLRNRFRSDNHIRTWGPRFHGIDTHLKVQGFIPTVGKQWTACVERATEGLQQIPNNRVYSFRYEDFVQNPENELSSISNAVGLDPEETWLKRATGGVSREGIGRGWNQLTTAEQAILEPIIQPAREIHDYN